MEFRCNWRTSIAGWDGDWVELRCNSVHLDRSELLYGWRLHKYLGTWIHVRQDFDGSDTSIGCRWYTIIVILIEVKCDLNCVNLVRVEMECKYWDLGVRWDLDWVETHILRPGYVAVELGWSWGAILLTWMDVRHEIDGCEMPTWPGCKMIWRILGHRSMWDGAWGLAKNWIVMRQKCGILDWVTARPGWRWHVNLGAWMDMGRDVGGGENHIATCIEWRWGLDGGEPLYGWRLKKKIFLDGGGTSYLGHGCRWGRTCIEVRHT